MGHHLTTAFSSRVSTILSVSLSITYTTVTLMSPKNQRGWCYKFYDDPGLATKQPGSFISPKSDKFKIFCKECYKYTIVNMILSDQKKVAESHRAVVHSKDTIAGQYISLFLSCILDIF